MIVSMASPTKEAAGRRLLHRVSIIPEQWTEDSLLLVRTWVLLWTSISTRQ